MTNKATGIPAFDDYSAAISDCADCDRTAMTARDARLHYVITGHYVIPRDDAPAAREDAPDAREDVVTYRANAVPSSSLRFTLPAHETELHALDPENTGRIELFGIEFARD